MANNLTPAQQNLLAAAAGNPALLELLESLLNTVGVQQSVTNTTGKNVPAQAKAIVSLLNGNYVVQITNPGGSSALSQLQAAQASQGATQATTLQSVTPILHQIRCATSPRFGVNDNVQVFGGDTGSTQTYWTLSGLGSGNFYFQIRSSYDGQNWNQWKNANGGQSVTASPSEVTVEQAANADWAVFTLPGGQLIAVGAGFVGDQGTFTLPANLYTSAMLALAGPNGVVNSGISASDISDCNVSIVVPANPSAVGIPDYPVIVNMKYGNQSTPQVKWAGSANIFAIAFDPAGKNVTIYPGGDGVSEWIVITLPGGGQLAIGTGKTADGATIFTPPVPWFNAANMLSICAIEGNGSSHAAHGVSACGLTGTTANAKYQDGSGNTWTGNARWLAVAWTPGANIQATTGGSWLVITLANGKKIAFGAGNVASGNAIALPTGFTADQMLGFATPSSFSDPGGHVMVGVLQCALEGVLPVLSYIDGQGNQWAGNTNWFAFAWT